MAAGKKKPTGKGPEIPGTGHLLRDDAEEQLARSPERSPGLDKQTPEQLIHELQVHQIELEIQAEELRKSKLALEDSRDRYLDLYDFAPVGYLTLSDKALITEVNLTGATLLGVERSRLVNARFSAFVADEDTDEWHWYFVNVLNQKEQRTCTLMLKRGGGSMFPAQLEGVLTTGSDGVNTVRIAIIDSTESRRAEEALRESEAKYRDIFEKSVTGLFKTKPDGALIAINDAFARIYDYSSAAEMIADNQKRENLYIRSKLYASSEDRKEIYRILAEKGKVENFESLHCKRDGTRIWMSITARVVCDPEGTILSVEGTVIDITKRKVAEEALYQASKKLKLLSSITRHDINNQLMSVNGFLGLLHKKVPDPTLEDYFIRITKASDRIAAMIQFTREYEEIGVTAPTWQDCQILVGTTETQVQPGQVVVKNNLPAGIEVFADPLIIKVFYNLMDNAMRYGGKITTIRFSVTERGGDQILICEDDGDGVVAEEKEKIFERGFGKNTGMGLFLAREILDITGITIKETGVPGKCARFEMTVPKGMWRIERKGT